MTNLIITVLAFALIAIVVSGFWFVHRSKRKELWAQVFANLPRVFISYRRGDSRVVADRLREALLQRHKIKTVFLDEDSIDAGAEFADVIGQRVSQATILFALIGPEWENITREPTRQPTYQLNDDWVKLEVEAASRMGAKVVPVLVGRPELPKLSDPPTWVKNLFGKNAKPLRAGSSDFDRDVEELAAIARQDIESTSDMDERISEITSLDMKSAWSIYSIAFLCILMMSFSMYTYLEMLDKSQVIQENSEQAKGDFDKRAKELKSDFYQLNEDLEDQNNEISELNKNRLIAPIDFDEYLATLQQLDDKAKLPDRVLMITEVVVARKDGDRVVFTSKNENLKNAGALALRVEDQSMISEIMKFAGRSVKIAARLNGGTSGFQGGKLETWWPLVDK